MSLLHCQRIIDINYTNSNFAKKKLVSRSQVIIQTKFDVTTSEWKCQVGVYRLRPITFKASGKPHIT